MGCLNIHLSVVGEQFQPIVRSLNEPILAKVKAISDNVIANIELINDFKCSAETIQDTLSIGIDIIGQNLKCRFSEICSTPQDFYVEAYPTIIWLSEENDYRATIEVKSNTNWTVE